MGRNLFDFFDERFRKELPGARTMQEAFTKATQKIETDLNLTPYPSFESFNKTRKRRKKRGRD
jgi:hypothetical protein